MADANVGLAIKRTFVYQDSFYQISDDAGASAHTIKFIQDWTFTPSMADFDIDNIDTADPIFTPKSDIKGTFNFVMKNTIDIYDNTIPPNDDLTASSWMIGIAIGEPVKITFITILKAPKANPAETLTIQFTGRIMDTPLTQVRKTGVHELEVIGEITGITKVQASVAPPALKTKPPSPLIDKPQILLPKKKITKKKKP